MAWALCFGARPAIGAAWLALVPLVCLLGSPRPALLGWVHGVVFWLVSIHWIAPTLETYGGLPRVLAVPTLVLLCAYLGAYHALFAGLGARLWRHSAGTALVGLPALWVVLEVVMTYLLSGFPWNLAAYAWIAVPGALPLTAFIGSYGLSYLVLLANVAIACLVLRRRPARALAAVAVVLAALASGLVGQSVARLDDRRSERPIVRLVQPDTPIVADPRDPRVEEGYRRVLDLTRRACEPGALVVWPESAAWPYLYGRGSRLDADLAALGEEGCALLLNSVSRSSGRYYNSALLLDGRGGVDRYDKTHLVPFGEYVPFGGRLPFLRRLARAAGDFTPGDDLALLSWRRLGLGVSICFEIIFPAEVAARARAGADVLVTITNDAWYGDTSAPWQHLRAARFRAAETRRPVLRAALTGVSAVISADGGVEEWLGVGETGILEARPVTGLSLAPYARAPWVVPAACVGLLAFAIFRSSRAPGGEPRGAR